MDNIGLFWNVLFSGGFSLYMSCYFQLYSCIALESFISSLFQCKQVRNSIFILCAGEEIKHLVIFLFTYVFTYLFSVLHHAKYLSVGCIVTGSQKGRGNQYIQLVYVLYCKLPTKGKQVLVFLLEDRSGFELQLQW